MKAMFDTLNCCLSCGALTLTLRYGIIIVYLKLEDKLKSFDVFNGSDVRHFLTAVCFFSLLLGGFSAPVYGMGKKEIRIAVSQPEGREITSGHEWLLVMVQRTLTDRLNKDPAKKVTAIRSENNASPPPPLTI
jgi:hypothetical protein